ncbi:hypothetical protein DPV87_07255 [Haemophilus parainfluenzae]|uniref:Uncharacterized protein n=1 Tax=Haemophilus parainfluenzae TaxID=729 RepID=A0A369Z2Z2_HAEPA|nr:hypothetical protein [Haemophilus parainfluenzae]RDE90205.1 hypothetical protein DPV87_07255 [Haemophilus parainfluenzae]
MAKPTTNNPEQGFIYQLGQDVAKLGIEIEQLKNKSVKAVRIVVPAKPEKYQQYGLEAVINLPPECQNAICIKSENGNVGLIETGETMSVYADSTASEFYLAPVYRLDAETINAELNQEQMSGIDAAQEREERERKEQQEREERDKAIYKYLAKWLTDNYLDAVRAKEKIDDLETHNVRIYVNKNGLDALLDKPFERNSVFPNYNNVEESIYADVKSAMLAEKARIDRGEVDLSTASDFELVDYNYINHLS